MNVKKGDKIIIIKGKDRGKAGKIIKVFPKEERVVVDGLNLLKKTIKPKKQGEKGQVVEAPGTINNANVMLVCHSCGKATRVGNNIEGKNKKRYCKKCKATV